jgi:hypothetical protein
MPLVDPIARVNTVADDLARLADELGDSIGADARRLLLHWRQELLQAVLEIRRMTQQPARN